MSETKFFDRELSWLEFNQRVLNEALNDEVPLFERLKFLAITSSNLDEFFRVRVGALTTLIESKSTSVAPSGLSPHQQLAAVRERVDQIIRDQYDCFLNELVPALHDAGVQGVKDELLNSEQEDHLRQIFDREVLSVLTPMAVGRGNPFPLLANQMMAMCVRLAPIETPDDKLGEELGIESGGKQDPSDDSQERYAVIPFGRTLSRFYSLPGEGNSNHVYMLLEDVVSRFIEDFFPGETIVECQPFRLTRNADVEVQELTPHGLAVNMADVLRARTRADCIRVEIDASVSSEMVEFLISEVDIEPDQLVKLSGPLDLGAFMELATRSGFEQHQYEPWPPLNSPDIPAEETMFDVISQRDVMLFHPYESFEPVVRLIDEAAADPDVIAIKQTLYRISRNSPIIRALKRAVDNGKHVTVLLELKARFDEERNLNQARELESIGAQVIHGVKGLKTHAKVCIIVRREPEGIQRYVHFGTGNYNESTAKIYSDVSLFTTDEDLGVDAIAFFNAISGYSQPPHVYRKIETAPLLLRSAIKEMIDAEAERAANGQNARIKVKLNALTDTVLIESLYKASQAGVKIFLNIRGICCLKPGVPGMSENIRVTSIVDRFLEHARIIYVHHGGDPKVYISSADWMPRNLDHRKELLVPVEDPKCRQRLIHIMRVFERDNVKAATLQPDGSYTYEKSDDDPECRAQEFLYREARHATRGIAKKQRTMFEPHNL
ncbi:polyphosphate kinase 1 [Thalassoglobus sp. JC818]|uniref:polyphosphate kinase 1 n=1 Tax=Thalassoglobus sp. JC818 TaxID=3232136 RepID=UPI003459402D